MVESLFIAIFGPLLLFSIILIPPIVGSKVLKKYGWIYVILTDVLVSFLTWLGPLSSLPAASTIPPLELQMFWIFIGFDFEVGFMLFGASLIWSLVSLRRRWYESNVLLYYCLVVFVDFIVLIPLATRLNFGI
jgi:hypothetical protein